MTEIIPAVAQSVAALIESALAAVLMLAAVSKLMDLRGFQRSLRPLRFMTEFNSRIVALGLPLTEFLLAGGLLAGQRVAVAGTLGLLSLFTVVAIDVVRRKLKVPCHCFGASDTLLSVATIRRNAILIGLAAFALVRSSIPLTLEEVLHGVIALALCVCLVALWRVLRQVKDLIALGGLPRSLM